MRAASKQIIGLFARNPKREADVRAPSIKQASRSFASRPLFDQSGIS
jgi:hypothetical protein